MLTNYADVLTILLRLRQLCCHPQLMGGSGISATVTTDGKTGTHPLRPSSYFSFKCFSMAPFCFLSSFHSGITEGACTPGELRARLLEKITLVLSSGSDEECAVCLESIRQPVITYCAHVYCKPCICEVIRTEKVRPRPRQLFAQ